MSTSKKSLRTRAVTVVGGLAVLGVTGAGLADSANAATSSSSAAATLAKIKYCESGGNYQAVNSSTGASGAYQFLTSTWKGLSASAGYATAASAPASVQDAAALELYQEAGTSPWTASSSCWSHLGAAPTSSSSSSTSSSSSSATASTNSTASTSASGASTGGTTEPTPHLAPQHGRGHAKPMPKHVGSVRPALGKHHGTPAPVKPMPKPANRLAPPA